MRIMTMDDDASSQRYYQEEKNGGGGSGLVVDTKTNPSEHRTVEQMLRQEKEELRQALIKVQENYQEVQQERNFYRVKVSELSEILETRNVSETLVQKTIQVAELVAQVDRLKHQQATTNAQLHKMNEQRDQNKKMLLELSNIVRTLHSVPVEYTASSKDPLQNVKTKVETIMEDRRLLVLRCQELEQENQQYQDRIQALETQFHLINTMNLAKADLPDDKLQEQQQQPKSPVAVIDRALSALSIATKLSEITTIEFLHDYHRHHPELTMEPCLNDDPSVSSSSSKNKNGNTSNNRVLVIVPKDQHVFRTMSKQDPDQSSYATATSTTYPTFITEQFSSPRFVDPPHMASASHPSPSRHDDPGIEDVDGSVSLHSSPSISNSLPEYISESDSDEIHRLQRELLQSRQQHQQFKQVCQTAFQKMKIVEQEYNQMKQQCDEAYVKRDELKSHLKDVIQQYKELNQDYEQAMDELDDAKSQIKYLENSLEEVKKEKEYWEDYGADILDQDGVADNVEKLKAAYLTARKTIQSLKEQLHLTQSELKEAEQRRVKGDRNYRDAVAQTRKLQHEQKILETRIADAKEQIQIAKKETQKYKEEAKHTRRRLTAYMQKEGIPTQSSNQLCMNEGLLLPQLLLF